MTVKVSVRHADDRAADFLQRTAQAAGNQETDSHCGEGEDERKAEELQFQRADARIHSRERERKTEGSDRVAGVVNQRFGDIEHVFHEGGAVAHGDGGFALVESIFQLGALLMVRHVGIVAAGIVENFSFGVDDRESRA